MRIGRMMRRTASDKTYFLIIKSNSAAEWSIMWVYLLHVWGLWDEGDLFLANCGQRVHAKGYHKGENVSESRDHEP